jgi:Putative peptidoglycan binding domain
MSKASGLFLILGGLAVAAYVMPSGNDASETGAAGRTNVAKDSQADERPSLDVAAIRPQPAYRPVAAATARAAEPVPAFSTPVVVTITQRPSEPSAASPRAAPIARDRDTLTRELQKELKRVGCYEGELNGAWTPATRRAMKAFTDRVNATLPVEEPDAILFTMVQGHQDRACGKPCPSGQGLNDEGRCLPNAILAKAVKKGPPPAAVAQLPKSNPAPAAMPAPATTGWSTVTTASAPAPAPALTPASAQVPVPAPAVASASPLAPPPSEGRMALAGPTVPPQAPTTAVRPASPAPPRAAVQQGSQASSWARSMQSRRFDSVN